MSGPACAVLVVLAMSGAAAGRGDEGGDRNILRRLGAAEKSVAASMSMLVDGDEFHRLGHQGSTSRPQAVAKKPQLRRLKLLGDAAPTAQTLQDKIALQKQAESLAVANEAEAEKALAKAVKSGSSSDYDEAQQVMENIKRNTALNTLEDMGYQCTKTKKNSDESKKGNISTSVASSAPNASKNMPVAANKTASNKTVVAREVQQALSLVQMFEEPLTPRTRIPMGLGAAADPDSESQSTTLKVEEAQRKADGAMEQMMNMNRMVAQMKQELEQASTKMKAVKLKAATNAVQQVQASAAAMEKMKRQLKNYMNLVRLATNNFAEKKVHEAHQFEGVMKERYYKSRDVTKAQAKAVENAREKEKLRVERATDAAKRIDDLKLNIEQMQVQADATKGDDIFASDADKKFADFKAKATRENLDAYHRQLSLAEQTLKSYNEDVDEAKRTVQEEIEKHTEAIHKEKKAQEEKNKAVAAVEEAKQNSAQLINRPLPDPAASAAEKQEQMNKEIAAEQAKTAAKIDHEREVREAENALKKAGESGNEQDLNKAQAELDRLTSPIKTSKCDEPVGTCKFVNRKCRPNGARCKGEKHNGDLAHGEVGELDCILPKDAPDAVSDCWDTLTSNGVFVPISNPGIGFCAPWLGAGASALSQPNSTQEAGASVPPDSLSAGVEAAARGGKEYIKSGDNEAAETDDVLLGETYVVRMGGFHPDGAKENVGILIFKRVVCQEETCETFKMSKCFVCERDIFRSKDKASTTVEENVDFIQNCALPMLKAHGEKVPKAHQCDRGDLLSAKRETIAW